MKFKRLIITLLFSFTVSGCQQSKSYIVTWKNYDGSVLEVDENVSYGTIPSYDGITPTREDDEENTYIFSGWSPNVTFVNGNQTYTAQYVNGFLEFSLNDDNNSYSVACRFDFDSTSIEIPSTYLGKPVTSIGDEAFSECSSLTSIVIPSSVTSIDESAFWGCSSLTSINVSDDNNNYSSIDGVLYNKNKTTLINYPYGKLENIFVIPSSVTSIGYGAFLYCSSLTSIVIPSSVTSIGRNAFSYCSSLTSIVIPDSVTSIGRNAFANCLSLTIYAEASSEPSGWDDNWNSSNRPVIWGYIG